MNVVIDTNVLVAALRSNKGASYRLLSWLPHGRYTPNISVPLFLEYEAVLKREGMAPTLDSVDIDAVLDFVLSKSRIRKIYFLWRPFLRDLKDDHLLEVAVASNSKYIVTFNVNDFRGIEKFGVKAVTPQEYLKLTGIMK
ncbi:MAG: putative toxin-antitoxin system toxin component, PIN family [Gammaproteobacteria bacterium]|nr:putative toxin-antitoxin system toxin component, PIN family [Gammaproteobacteria bacterium]MDE0512739.1 putative toxin-antitoxin system toxin component, PIN family [Gammaproteobacteria bacterium]